MTDDDDISRRYRELPREEPPRHLDDAIRAAARRAVHTRPAPLVVPTGRQRWYFPLAAAAIIVLAVAVTMHVEREQPGEEVIGAPPAAPAASPPPALEVPREEARAEKPKPSPDAERLRRAAPAGRELRDAPVSREPQEGAAAPARDAVTRAQEQARAEAVERASPARERGNAGMVQGRVEATAPSAVAPPQSSTDSRRADEAARASSQLAKSAYSSPEQWLQGIADLRAQGRHDEADRELAEFRKRYPNYRIPQTVLDKVEKR